MTSVVRRWWEDWMHGAPAAASERAGTRLAAHLWPGGLASILDRLREGGHAAYLVGGTVRDVLLGLEPRAARVGKALSR